MENSKLYKLPKELLIKIIEKDFEQFDVENISEIMHSCINKLKEEKMKLHNFLNRLHKIGNIEIKLIDNRRIEFYNLPCYLSIKNINSEYDDISIKTDNSEKSSLTVDEMFPQLDSILQKYLKSEITRKIINLVRKIIDNINSFRILEHKIYYMSKDLFNT